MADISDVENALTAQVSQVIYPRGQSEPGLTPSVCRIYRGWPTPSSLNADLAAGIVNISISPAKHPDTILDSYLDPPTIATSRCGLVGTVVDQTITFSGIPAGGEFVGILIDGQPQTYVTTVSDTPSSIAANLAAEVRSLRPAVLSGASITLKGSYSVVLHIANSGIVNREIRRQIRDLQVICWSPGADLRDLVCSSVDSFLSEHYIIDLDDGSRAVLRYKSTESYDQAQNSLLFRRDLIYSVQYSTIIRTPAPPMILGGLALDNTDTYT